MERLTYRSPKFKNPVSRGACNGIDCSFDCDSCKINDLITKLCAYEDTGLEPEEIADFMKRWERAVEIAGICKKGGIDHLLELKKAEQDGLLVVLPCKVGADIYRVGAKEVCSYWQIERAEIYQDEIVLVDDSDNVIFHEDLGKTVFLTREEAEAALKGGEG